MLEKNMKKQCAKRYRVMINIKMGTMDHKLATRPSRNELKADTRKQVRGYGY
ncbi:MAG: hypothetical protein MJ131_05340 [Lachnospiraceae bacterium]|nr:hypothetical protein [Lachnospiraceae bacterium]